jgi:hypothetical protein
MTNPSIDAGPNTWELILPLESHPNPYCEALEWLRRERGVMRIATPFFTADIVADLASQRGGAVEMLTDADHLPWNLAGAPDEGLDIIRKLVTGGRLRSMPGLHAKLLWCGDKAIIGSANVTYAGFGGNVELGVRLEGISATGLPRLWQQLWDRSQGIAAQQIVNDPQAQLERALMARNRTEYIWKLAPFPKPTHTAAPSSRPALEDPWAFVVEKMKLSIDEQRAVKVLVSNVVKTTGLERGHDAHFAVNWRRTDDAISFSIGSVLVLRVGRNRQGWWFLLPTLRTAPSRAGIKELKPFGGHRAAIHLWEVNEPSLHLAADVSAAWHEGLLEVANIERGATSQYNRSEWTSVKGDWVFG